MAIKKTIIVQIPQPCYEGWDKMTKNEKGRFCDSCAKTVVDFSTKSDAEIVQIIKKTDGKICGYFRTTQVNRKITIEKNASINYFYPLPYLLSGFLLLAIPSCNFSNNNSSSAPQVGEVKWDKVDYPLNDTIRGRVLDSKSLEPLSGMEIDVIVKNVTIGSLTSKNDGTFEFIAEKGLFEGKIQLKVNDSGFYNEELIMIDSNKDLPWNKDIHLNRYTANYDDVIYGDIIVVEEPKTKKQQPDFKLFEKK